VTDAPVMAVTIASMRTWHFCLLHSCVISMNEGAFKGLSDSVLRVFFT